MEWSGHNFLILLIPLGAYILLVGFILSIVSVITRLKFSEHKNYLVDYLLFGGLVSACLGIVLGVVALTPLFCIRTDLSYISCLMAGLTGGMFMSFSAGLFYGVCKGIGAEFDL